MKYASWKRSLHWMSMRDGTEVCLVAVCGCGAQHDRVAGGEAFCCPSCRKAGISEIGSKLGAGWFSIRMLSRAKT